MPSLNYRKGENEHRNDFLINLYKSYLEFELATPGSAVTCYQLHCGAEHFLEEIPILMSALKIPLFTIVYLEDRKDILKSSPFLSWPGAMINPQWLELLMSRTNFHGPKDVWATEVQL